MAFKQIFAPLKRNSPVRVVANYEDNNKIRNILNDLQGVNCRVEKPDQNQGLGWRIVVGDGTDVERPPNIADPYAEYNEIIVANVTGENGSWTYNGTDSNNNTVSGTCLEVNGLDAPESGISILFTTHVVLKSDGGTATFNYPMPDPENYSSHAVLTNNFWDQPTWKNPVANRFRIIDTPGASTFDIEGGNIHALCQSISVAGASAQTVSNQYIYAIVTLSAGNTLNSASISIQNNTKTLYEDGNLNYLIGYVDSSGVITQYKTGDIYGPSVPDNNPDDEIAQKSERGKIIRLNELGHPEWAYPATFTASISGSGPNFSFTEQIIDDTGSWTSGPRSGTCYERNGLKNGLTSSVFKAEVTESYNRNDGVSGYSFTMPIHDLDSSYKLLRVNGTGDGFEWGCAEIT